MRFIKLFIRVTCAKLAFVAGLGIAPAVAAPTSAHPAAIVPPAAL